MCNFWPVLIIFAVVAAIGVIVWKACGRVKSEKDICDMPKEKEVRQDEIDLAYLQAELPLGTEFDYLGVRVRVCGHDSYHDVTQLRGDYVDGRGKFAPVSFGMHEVRTLVEGPNAVTIIRKENDSFL